MGNLIYNFSQFVNENENKEASPAQKLITAASAHGDMSAFKAENYTSNADLGKLMDELVKAVSSAKGEHVANEFTQEAAAMLATLIKEDACKVCEEMMEPCDDCKAHAKEMEEKGEGEKL